MTDTGAYPAALAIRRRWRFDLGLARELAEIFSGRWVCEFGAGVGLYASYLAAHGVMVAAYDGIPGIDVITSGRVKQLDLSQQVEIREPVDWALCLEVMEHMPEKFEANALAILHASNRRGIVMSWAAPGQRGRGHVNCQPPEHAVAWAEGLGYQVLDDWQKRLRAAAKYDCFRKNLLVFGRKKQGRKKKGPTPLPVPDPGGSRPDNGDSLNSTQPPPAGQAGQPPA